MVIPRSTGPLRHLGGRGRRADELDELIDELFGDATDEGPGLFDALLVLGGLAIVAWATLTSAGGLWIVIGGFALVLGLALPARGVVRVARRQRLLRSQRRAMTSGYVLEVSHPDTSALVAAYEHLLDVAPGSGVLLADRALEAAHRAVVDVATLLHGEPPLADAQVDYVRKRTAAIRDTTAQLRRANRAWSRAAQPAAAGPPLAERRRRAEAVARAREELEASDRLGSVHQLETVQELLRKEADGATD